MNGSSDGAASEEGVSCEYVGWFLLKLLVAAGVFVGLGLGTPWSFHLQLMTFCLAGLSFC